MIKVLSDIFIAIARNWIPTPFQHCNFSVAKRDMTPVSNYCWYSNAYDNTCKYKKVTFSFKSQKSMNKVFRWYLDSNSKELDSNIIAILGNFCDANRDVIPVLYHCWYHNSSTILVNTYKRQFFSFKSAKNIITVFGGI